jgi:DNA glycosylase AlkZ-like
MDSLNAQQTRRLRLRAQRMLAGTVDRPTTPAQVLAAVCGVQAQDLPAGLLSMRARSTGLSAAEIERARQEGHTIAWTWCLRGTLHLVSTADANWLVPLMGPSFIAGDRRRFQQLGWDEPKAISGLRLVSEALQRHGALTRAEIIHLLKENNLPSEGQAPVHLLYRAALEGLLCAGPNRGKEPTYVLWKSWLGELQHRPFEEALSELARRYLQAYAPAGPEDLASWSGLKLGEARQAWQLIAGQLVQVQAAGKPAWLLKSQLPWLEDVLAQQGKKAEQVRLLPRFDTYLLGYAGRDLAVDPAYARRIHPGGGILNAALLVDGQALGTWKTQRRRGRLEVQVEPFEPLANALLPLIEAEVADVGRFLGVDAALVIKK